MRTFRWLPVLLVAASWFLVLDKAFCQDRASAPLARPYSPVILSGDQFPDLLGLSIDAIRVARAEGESTTPVPFQIDQRDKNGNLILPLGPKGNRRERDRVFDENDELVFMAMDAGPMLSDALRASLPKPNARIRLREGVGAPAGEVYLFADESGAWPLSAVDYVDFDEAKHRTLAIGYELGSEPTRPAHIRHIAPGPAGARRNVVDRLKLRAWGKLLGIVDIRRTEEDIVSSLNSYIDGPVRVIRDMDYALRAIWGFTTPSVSRQTPSYAYHTSFPNDMKIPFKLGRVFTEAQLLSGFDFRPEMGEADLYCDDFKEPVRINGTMEDNERELYKFNPVWWVARGEFGCMAFFLVVNEDLRRTGVEASLVYSDDTEKGLPPENVPGTWGQTLYEMGNILETPKGMHRFDVIFYFPPECSGEPEAPILHQWKNDLEVTVLP